MYCWLVYICSWHNSLTDWDNIIYHIWLNKLGRGTVGKYKLQRRCTYCIYICTYITKMTISYRVFIKYCVFYLEFYDFSKLCQFWCSAGVWHWGKTSPEYILKSSKKTQYLMNTPCIMYECSTIFRNGKNVGVFIKKIMCWDSFLLRKPRQEVL